MSVEVHGRLASAVTAKHNDHPRPSTESSKAKRARVESLTLAPSAISTAAEANSSTPQNSLLSVLSSENPRVHNSVPGSLMQIVPANAEGHSGLDINCYIWLMKDDTLAWDVSTQDIRHMSRNELVAKVAAPEVRKVVQEREAAWVVFLAKSFIGCNSLDTLPPFDELVKVTSATSIQSLLPHCNTVGLKDDICFVNILIASRDEVDVRRALINYRGPYPLHENSTIGNAAKELLSTVLIDRVAETFDLLVTWIYFTNTIHNFVLPVVSEMSGMGKTTFAMLFRQVMKREPEKTAEQRRVSLQSIKAANCFGGLLRPFTEEEEATVLRNDEASVLKAAIGVVLDRTSARGFDFTWKAFENAAVIRLVADAGADVQKSVKSQVLRALQLNEDLALTVHELTHILTSVSERRPIFVIDDFERWDSHQFSCLKRVLTARTRMVKAPLLFAGTATTTILHELQHAMLMTFKLISLKPAGVEHIQEMLRQTTKLLNFDASRPAERLMEDAIAHEAKRIHVLHGGHVRSIACEVYDVLCNTKSVIPAYLTADIVMQHFQHFASAVHSCQQLVVHFYPYIALVVILDKPIHADRKLQEILVGFPLPFHRPKSTHKKQLWEARVGSVTKRHLQTAMRDMFGNIPIASLKEQGASKLLQLAFYDVMQPTDTVVVTSLQDAFATAAVAHKLLLDMTLLTASTYTVNSAMPFLKAVGLDETTPWPNMLTVDKNASLSELVAAYTRGPEVGDGETGCLLTDAGSNHAVNCMLTRHFHLLVHCSQDVESADGGLSLQHIAELCNNLPTTALKLFAESGIPCILVLLSTQPSSQLLELIGGSDVMVIHPGAYSTDVLANAHVKEKLVECNTYMLDATTTAATEPIRVTDVTCTHPSTDALCIPDGVRVVLVNPSTKTSVWRQLVYLNVTDFM